MDQQSKINNQEKKINNQEKKKYKRCFQCKKKLKMIHFTCRCNHMFCVVHQNPHSHNCSFNNKKVCQEAIELNNPQTTHQKLVKI